MNRDSQIISMRKNGYPMNVISQKFGISTQRVQQICKDPAGKRKRIFGVDISNELYLLLQRNDINNISELRQWMTCHELTEIRGVGPKRAGEILQLATTLTAEDIKKGDEIK